ncbi:MAG: toll/interleukin-1 receptor domain-containing protein, partial [Deltaproteobacteria bacterium]|nr:toll/interleukin-1 receptor domain-containing protein [Deltaproteobacteria bacterium]
MTALTALAAAAFAPPDDVAIPAELEPALRLACAGAWRAVEVVLAGDVLRGRIAKTRDAIVRDAVELVLALHGNVGIRVDALTALRDARDEGELDGPLDLPAVIAGIRQHGAVAAGRGAIAVIRRELAHRRELEQALADAELASLLVDTARAILRTLARDPDLARWAIGPTGSPARDRALAAFAELATTPESIAELETLIAVPIHLDDNVQFTVYRPRSIDPGKWHQLLAFAHLAERRPGEDDLPDPVEEVQRQAKSVLGAKAQHYQPVVQDAGAAIPEEGELTFVPEFPGIEVNPPRRSFLWLESVHREEFRIRAGRELDGKTVRGRVTVFLGHIAIAEVACSVRVDAAHPEPTKREPVHARAYRKIFASYSHRDLDIVNQFETYARALGDEYLRDWVHLRTGEVWNDRLFQLIEQADAFQLFWSRNSMHSKFVRHEYEYALSLNRPSFVRPTYWEDPMPTEPGLPPEALLRLHFQKLSASMIGDVGSRTDVDAGESMKKASREDRKVRK